VRQQFIEIGEALGWDLNAQIEQLDEFVRLYGAAGRLDAELAEIGLAMQQPLHREALREAMMRFIERLGAAGAFSRYLHDHLRAQQRAVQASTQAPSVQASAPGAVTKAAQPAKLKSRLSPSALRQWMKGQGRSKPTRVAS